MKFYFQSSFIKEIKKLQKKKSYDDCEEAIIKDVFIIDSEDIFELCSATRLNPSGENPIAKLRICSDKKGKSSSYRLYLLALKVKENLYFAYLHPKTGVYGKESLTTKEKKDIIKNLLDDVKNNNLLEVCLNDKKDKIIFTKDNKEVF